MPSDGTLAQQVIRLLHEKEQQTIRLLELAMRQNQLLLAENRQQRDLIAQQLDTIKRLEAQLRDYQLTQQTAFNQIHTN